MNNKKPRKQLLLIDGNSYVITTANMAYSRIKEEKGTYPTSKDLMPYIISNFEDRINYNYEKYNLKEISDYVTIVFDTGVNYRKQLTNTYKAHRDISTKFINIESLPITETMEDIATVLNFKFSSYNSKMKTINLVNQQILDQQVKELKSSPYLKSTPNRKKFLNGDYSLSKVTSNKLIKGYREKMPDTELTDESILKQLEEQELNRLKSLAVQIIYIFNTFVDEINQKLNEQKNDEEAKKKVLSETLKLFQDYLDEKEIKYNCKLGYEGDDLIATMVSSVRPTTDVIILSGDKDITQLIVKPNIYMQGMVFNTDLDDYPFYSYEDDENYNQVIFKKILIGDTSDNIKGVPGIGPKTADQYLEYGDTLEDFLINKDTPQEYLDKILENRENVLLNKELITLSVINEKLKTNNLNKLKLNRNDNSKIEVSNVR